ncbi:MAG TPA: bifunctional phosphopantothenoylcysteine decarboxylase/phosphopantothenate--cysteine ligase CoaBC [Clostridiales bacterium]|nr:bifunctional phosphopantothenoylcysteine decarboxylase/phosphopantothenate--cysteine ligase CoaBC [Clostridiales bacterium]
MDYTGKTAVLGVTGGIAAYKACDLVSRLRKKGLEIRVIMTAHACEFVQPLTLEVLSGARVVTDQFDRDFPWEVEHIALAKAADVFAVVPATANVLAKYAHGIADDMLSTTLLATRAPVLFAPAMNTAMYENPAVQDNIAALRARGCLFVEPAEGHLACGDTGRGKLAEVSVIEQAILDALTPKDMAGMHVTVTAGPTREALDPVRFLSNHSTGKMGYAIARSAKMRGASVTLITGPVSLPPVDGVTMVPVTSACEMRQAVLDVLPQSDFVIKAAAVGDYRPAACSDDKIKKQDGDLSIPLVRNPDILAEIGQKRRDDQVICGFSMETRDLVENSEKKLNKKNCDVIVANNLKVQGAGFAGDTNVVTLLYRDGRREPLELMGKDAVADVLLDRLLALRAGKQS